MFIPPRGHGHRWQDSPPTPCSPSASSPATWSKSGAPITCSPSKTTSRPCRPISPCSSNTAHHRTSASRLLWPTGAWNPARFSPTTRLNGYLDFPCVGQALAIERQTIEKKTGKTSIETVYGLTSHTPQTAAPARLLAFNRAHWGIDSHHYLLDWNWDEDRCTLRTGHGPENITRLRRFAIGLIKSKSHPPQTRPQCPTRLRLVSRMTDNSLPRSQRPCARAG
jgi:hypothetical protein